ncbi:hypothetical protein BVX99_02410 [bacterium F16]|nr:hypothetical protein BVX99_02410 [bacterium F16]
MVLATYTPLSFGSLINSKHDFSGQSWANQRLCVPCHPPHNASTTEPLLWNRELSGSSYDPYTSPTLTGQQFELASQSKLCLSCHDGVVAVDSFDGNSGSTYVSGTALIGTNLANDHPIGIKWEHQTLNNGGATIGCDSCHENFSNVPTKMNAPFFGQSGQYTVECVSCHDPHGEAGFSSFLRMTNDASALCLQCHEN